MKTRNPLVNFRSWLALLTLLALCAASGCGGLFKPKPAPDIYTLNQHSRFAAELPSSQAQVIVAEPTSGTALNTSMIAVKTTQQTLKYYEQANWPSRAPQMLQTLLLEAFENSGKLPAVGLDTISLRPDYILQIDVRDFQAESFSGQGVTVRVRLNLKLINANQAKICAASSFESEAQAAGGDMSGIVAAFEQATDKVLTDSVSWTLSSLAKQGKPVK